MESDSDSEDVIENDGYDSNELESDMSDNEDEPRPTRSRKRDHTVSHDREQYHSICF